jgi:hypothetical protein
MKKIKEKVSNLNTFEIVLIFFILILMGYIGYLATKQDPHYLKDRTANNSPVAQDVSSAPNIANKKDLDRAAQILDKNDPAASSIDAKTLNSQSRGL